MYIRLKTSQENRVNGSYINQSSISLLYTVRKNGRSNNILDLFSCCDLFFHNLPRLICILHLRVRLDQVARTGIVRVLTKYFLDRIAFNIRSAALVALFKLHFLSAPTSVLDIL